MIIPDKCRQWALRFHRETDPTNQHNMRLRLGFAEKVGTFKQLDAEFHLMESLHTHLIPFVYVEFPVTVCEYTDDLSDTYLDFIQELMREECASPHARLPRLGEYRWPLHSTIPRSLGPAGLQTTTNSKIGETWHAALRKHGVTTI